MNQSTTTSVKDLLPDNCFLNLEDDDNETLDLMTDVNNTYYPTPESDHLRNEHFDLENVESASDSDGDSGGGEDEDSFIGLCSRDGKTLSTLKMSPSFSRRDVAASLLKVSN